MWISSRFATLIDANLERDRELAALRAENALLKTQLVTAQNHFDWIRIRLNALELERAQLLEKAYNVRVPVPEIARNNPAPIPLGKDLFEDMGDVAAKEAGLPILGL